MDPKAVLLELFPSLEMIDDATLDRSIRGEQVDHIETSSGARLSTADLVQLAQAWGPIIANLVIIVRLLHETLKNNHGPKTKPTEDDVVAKYETDHGQVDGEKKAILIRAAAIAVRAA